MDWLHVVILGVIEGLTEFLPISSTAHLTIAERLFGIPLLDPGITAFTAVGSSAQTCATIPSTAWAGTSSSGPSRSRSSAWAFTA